MQRATPELTLLWKLGSADCDRLSVPVAVGTFYAWDKLPALFQFVLESLVDGWQPFELIAPGSQKLKEAEDVALAECNLVSVEARAPEGKHSSKSLHCFSHTLPKD